jgi:hypothetical protein
VRLPLRRAAAALGRRCQRSFALERVREALDFVRKPNQDNSVRLCGIARIGIGRLRAWGEPVSRQRVCGGRQLSPRGDVFNEYGDCALSYMVSVSDWLLRRKLIFYYLIVNEKLGRALEINPS